MRKVPAIIATVLCIVAVVSGCVVSPVVNPDVIGVNTSPSQFIVINSDTGINIELSLEKRFYSDNENIVLDIQCPNLSSYPNSRIVLVPTTCAHNEIYNASTYKTILLSDISDNKIACSVLGYDLGAYDFRLFADITVDGQVGITEVGYISFVINEKSGLVPSTPSYSGYGELSGRIQKLFGDVFNSDNLLRVRYAALISGERIIITQGEHLGERYYEYNFNTKKICVLCHLGEYYTLLHDSGTMFTAKSALYDSFPIFCLDTSNAVSLTAGEEIDGVMYEYDEVLLPAANGMIMRYYFAFGTNELKYVRTPSGDLFEILSYDLKAKSSWFDMPDYSIIDYPG